MQLGNSAEALKFYEKLQSYFLKHAKADEAFSSQLNYLLARSLVKSGQILRAGGNLKQALMNCQEALSLIEKINVNELPIAWLRIELASKLAGLGAVQRRLGQPKEAVRSIRRAIELVEQLPMLAPRDYFNLACYHSELAAIASNEASIITTEEGKAEVEQAMKSLHQAIAEGFTGVGRLKSAASLELLRPRADFQKLVKELEAKVSKLNGMISPLREKK
ncbi:tetratricopeptide repeat protein [Telmatocola sphagniphila]|uniref:Tetratricopeptide repeat protein n=1 Tax=Telmatocola sphagniphila TaxID=1123043 RepID=A0A8E6B9W8_9BACT|nr:tetratricopeptide repeat protein [Telmatocola sphagniphila]